MHRNGILIVKVFKNAQERSKWPIFSQKMHKIAGFCIQSLEIFPQVIPRTPAAEGATPRAPTPAQPLATLRHHTAQAARINTPLKLRVLIRRPRGLQLRRYDWFRGQLGGNGVGAAFDLKWPRHDGDLFELFEERQ